MPKQLMDFQSAVVITTLGDKTAGVTIHRGNGHNFSPEAEDLLIRVATYLQAELLRLNQPTDK